MKVVNSKQLDADLKVVADAIRAKSGTSENLEFPDGMKEAIEGIEAGAIDFSSGFDDATHSLWGVWRLNADFHWAMSSGNSTINFKFYGYVDGVYKNGVSAHFQDTYTGPTYLYVENVLVWDYMDGVANVNKLTDSLVSFGATPQTFTDTYFYDAFKARASLVTVDGGGDNIQTQEKTVEITESGTVEVLPDEGYLLSKVTANVNVSGGGESKLAQVANKTVTEITESDLDGATQIPQYMFENCKSLVSVKIPSSVKNIGTRSFDNCSGITNLLLNEGLQEIGSYGFQGLTNLKTINFPSTLSRIREYAFQKLGCENLVIPNGINIEKYVFSYMPNLTSVFISKDAFVNINFNTSGFLFSYSKKLTDITFEEGIASILDGLFSYCTAIKTIVLPASVTNIGPMVFNGCTGFERIIIKSPTPPTIQSDTFKNVPTTCVFEVPANSVDTYKSFTNWSVRADQIVASEEF